ncbi:PfkB family carbohydrate kinase [Prauserella cavernicola]|uniref:Ribokinase n=1 Tax=Prauserella cavernicola TaxID=2800127 RepID=A0A934V3D8_9PSEU|nr:PfkB family carbohydrate kinase [Prauserella cavernicola]MBK1783564.1 bifunctional hydroxymethylpyrimidine kinase/phosphomethylpyrimidine kinase [Prauserella cavernicola]
MSRVWVVGSVNEDTRLGLSEHVRPGETVTAESLSRQLGGKGLNQAVAARRAGAATTMIAAVGADGAGESTRALLAAEGIAARIFTAPGPTGTAVVAVDDAGENAIIVVPGANALLPDAHVRAHLETIAAADVLLLQLELPLATVRLAAASARRAGATVVLNAAPYRPDAATLLADVDLLVVNAAEAGHLAPGHDDPADAARELARRERLAVLVTLGARGSLLVRDGESVPVPSCVTEVVDTTGAGDVYIGFLAAALADGADPRAAMELASTAAATAVSRIGATAAIPTIAELGVAATG